MSRSKVCGAFLAAVRFQFQISPRRAAIAIKVCVTIFSTTGKCKGSTQSRPQPFLSLYFQLNLCLSPRILSDYYYYYYYYYRILLVFEFFLVILEIPLRLLLLVTTLSLLDVFRLLTVFADIDTVRKPITSFKQILR